MSRYINPFTDFGFKRIFGEESNIDILMNFLNALQFHPLEITKIAFKKNENLGKSIVDRKAIFDLYCQDSRGNRFIVELQRVEQEFFKDRALYYSTFAIQEQAGVGTWNYKLAGVYFIGILDFELKGEKEKKDKYMHNIVLMDKDDKTIFYNKLEYKFIEVPKFNKKEDELETILDKWIYFFKYLHTLEERPDFMNNDMFIKAFGIAEMNNLNKEKRLEYEASLKAYRDLYVILDESFEKGKNEGKVEGEVIGIEKGKIESLENSIITILETKFNSPISQKIIDTIKSYNDIEILNNLLIKVINITTIEELENIL